MRKRVGLLGSSGLVAQHLQHRLAAHPDLDLVAVAGGPASRGSALRSRPWVLEAKDERPEIIVDDCLDAELPSRWHQQGIDVVVSALPSDPARTIESRITRSGLPLFSNASSHRMHPDVPLVIADLDLSPMERFGHGDLGPMACSTNCTVIPVVLPIGALMEGGELTQVSVQTEQALSGGGLGLLRDPSRRSKEVGHPIPGEAEKIEEEFRRLTMVRDSTSIDVATKRTADPHGHLVRVRTTWNRTWEEEEVLDRLRSRRSAPHGLGCPSAPLHPLEVVHDSPSRADHLQPTTADDHRHLHGMTIVVGAVRVDDSTIEFNALSDNLERGAAGGCLLLVEAGLRLGLLE